MHETDHSNGGEPEARPAVSVPEETVALDQDAFQAGMRIIRMRRMYFFATVIAYMPLMWAVNKISPTFRSMAVTFVVWVVVLFITALYSAVARCPRCGNYFHMHGMSLLYLRRCLHCQLHVTADKA
jgi:magnesium-transporting ATPase (P-type)